MAEERTGMVQVELSEADWKQRAEKLASEETTRIALVAKKKTHNAKWNEELIQLRESIGQLTEEVESHSAWIPAQADMFGNGNGAGNGEYSDEEDPPKRRRGGRRARGEAIAAS